jgi:hypothetical protein
MAKNTMWLIIGAIIVVVLVVNPGILGNLGIGGQTTTPTSTTPGDASAACNFAPTLDDSAKDSFSTTAISSLAYFKVDGNPATTNEPQVLNKGESYQVWYDNVTYYVEPKTFSATCGSNKVVLNGWANSSVALSGYDLVNRQTSSGSTYNTSMGANDQANIQLSYQGTAKKSAMPFGGVLIVEYNASLTSVSCTGADITESNDFHVTHTPSATTHTYRIWKVLPSIDDGSGAVRTIDCQFKNGATAVGEGSAYYFKLIPADYYVSDAGNIVLDVEQFANQATTRTGHGTISLTSYWGA